MGKPRAFSLNVVLLTLNMEMKKQGLWLFALFSCLEKKFQVQKAHEKGF